MIKYIVIMLLTLGVYACQGQPEKGKISTAEFAAIMEKGDVMVLDVRTPEEHAQGHIPQSSNIDFLDDSFEEKVGMLDRDKTYLLYCRSGARSESARKKMNEMGFKDVYDLDGGFMAWR